MSFLSLFQGPQRRNRFDLYDPVSDLKDPRVIGLISNDNDHDLGLPSLNRRENVQVVASNCSGDGFHLTIKWRPIDKLGYVCQTTKFEIEIDGHEYEHEQTVVYKPSLSTLRANRIAQYGAPNSNLKLYIPAPYRRTRVLFHGQMQNKQSPDDTKFVRVNFVMAPTSRIFDFKAEYNPKVTKTDSSIANDKLVLQDRHEQLVRIVGDFLMDGAEKKKKQFFAWGFHSRHFLDSTSQEVRTKRIFAHFNNGRAFQVGQSSLTEDPQVPAESSRVEFGYTCFEILPVILPIEGPTVINWDHIEEKSSEFSLEVCGGKKFDCTATRRSDTSNFFQTELDRKEGWATILIDDAFDSKDFLEYMRERELELEKAINEGSIYVASNYTETVNQDSKEPLLTEISDATTICSDLVGSKAASLAHLRGFSSKQDSGFVVPNAIVLTKFAYDILLELNPSLKEASEANCKSLQKLIEESPLPEALYEVLAQHETKFAQPVAVRSSSWGEDEEGMSAAGQLTTFLNVQGLDSIGKAVMNCFASKFNHANIQYKRQHGLPLNLPMAVVIQEMVACEKAGVLFTCDPTNGDDSLIIITANYGLGESVVSGQSEPDSIRVRVKGDELSIEEKSIGQKKIIIGLEGDNQDRSQCCLSDEEILKLARCGKALAKYFQSHRDIEWGFKGDQLYLFQSRPVTGIDSYTELELLHECDQPSRGEIEFSTRANIGEVMPYAIKPFTLTCTVFAWNVIAHRWLSKISPVKVDFCPEIPNGLIYDSYHSFFRLRCSQLFRSGESSDKKSLMSKAMDISFFGREIGQQPDLVDASRGLDPPPDPFEGFRYEVQTTPLRWMPTTVIMREKRTMRDLRVKVRQLKLATGYEKNKMQGLFNQIKNMLESVYDCWYNHIVILLMSTKANMGLSAMLSKYINDPVQLFAVSNKILAIGHDVISAEIPHRIAEMSEIIRLQGEVGKFLEMSDEEALKYMKEGGGAKLKLKWEDFLEKFGHRCYNEFEISEKSWREDEIKIVDMVRTNCKTGSSSCKQNEKAETIDEVLRGCNFDLSFVDRSLIKFVIGPKCMRLVAARERTKDILVEYHDIMREASRLLAKEMVNSARIPDEDLLYYFFYDEVDPLIREPQPALVVQALRRRNLFNTSFKELWKFDEVIRGHHVVPNHLKPTKELEEAVANAPKLRGTPASSGRVQGIVCLVKDYTELHKVRPGEILLTHSTDIAFSPVFPLITGIITEVGGLISHGAVVAREYGLPSLLGIPDVTRILQDREEIILDADNGVIVRLGKTKDGV